MAQTLSWVSQLLRFGKTVFEFDADGTKGFVGVEIVDGVRGARRPAQHHRPREIFRQRHGHRQARAVRVKIFHVALTHHDAGPAMVMDLFLFAGAHS
jgi:hypothetical protein